MKEKILHLTGKDALTMRLYLEVTELSRQHCMLYLMDYALSPKFFAETKRKEDLRMVRDRCARLSPKEHHSKSIPFTYVFKISDSVDKKIQHLSTACYNGKDQNAVIAILITTALSLDKGVISGHQIWLNTVFGKDTHTSEPMPEMPAMLASVSLSDFYGVKQKTPQPA